MGLYENIKEACKRKGTSVFALEQKLDFSRGQISKFNKNSPSIKILQKVADALELTVNDLLEEPQDTIMPDDDLRELNDIAKELPKGDIYALLEQARRLRAYYNAFKELENREK